MDINIFLFPLEQIKHVLSSDTALKNWKSGFLFLYSLGPQNPQKRSSQAHNLCILLTNAFSCHASGKVVHSEGTLTLSNIDSAESENYS